MTTFYIFWLWLCHKLTGRAVVLVTDSLMKDEVGRIVHYRLRFGAWRPVVFIDGYCVVLCVDGKTQGALFDDHKAWKPMFGSFKPSVVATIARSSHIGPHSIADD